MRQVDNQQFQIGQQDIAKIWLDPKSRDDIPQLLRDLQHINSTPEIRNGESPADEFLERFGRMGYMTRQRGHVLFARATL